ncbi:MAG TPA: DUF222 domain-containing protein, partial [Acidimicrobiales bacterium]|nr:DUF222 domain-containing protein [Acidimicrobiales bacterium]
LGKVAVGEAISTLEASRALAELPDTADVVKEGKLSSAQVKEVTRAARKDPSAEAELLRLAENQSLKDLRDRARQVMAQSASRQDEAERYLEIYRRRYLRHWTGPEGDFRLDARLAPDHGARLMASIEAEANAIFEEARQQGRRELPDAYKADALVALVTGRARTGAQAKDKEKAKGPSSAGTDTIVIRVDATALRRGFVKGGEMCEIAGVGPVPVATVERLLPGAFSKTLVRNAKDVLSVSHGGRAISTYLETALCERDPCCVWPGCSVTHGLEAHHWRENFAVSGKTSLDELALVCQYHHDLISYRGWALEGGPGHWRTKAPAEQDTAKEARTNRSQRLEQPEFADTG